MIVVVTSFTFAKGDCSPTNDHFMQIKTQPISWSTSRTFKRSIEVLHCAAIVWNCSRDTCQNTWEALSGWHLSQNLACVWGPMGPSTCKGWMGLSGKSWPTSSKIMGALWACLLVYLMCRGSSGFWGWFSITRYGWSPLGTPKINEHAIPTLRKGWEVWDGVVT